MEKHNLKTASFFEKTKEELNAIIRSYYLLRLFSVILILFIISAFFSILLLFTPLSHKFVLSFFLLYFIALVFIYKPSTSPKVTEEKFKLALDIFTKDPKKSPFYQLEEDQHFWRKSCENFKQAVLKKHQARWYKNLKYLGIVSGGFVFLLYMIPSEIRNRALDLVFFNVKDRQAALTILNGKENNLSSENYELDPSLITQVELKQDNLLKLDLILLNKSIQPELILKNEETHDIFQSFQIPLLQEKNGRFLYQIEFTIKESVSLFIPTIDTKKPLAQFKLHKLPLPLIGLNLLTEIKETWPDDKPIKLSIKAHADNFLQLVQLIIQADGKESKEIIHTITTRDKKDLTTEYELVLEPYLTQDLSRVEITAQAIDWSAPEPLIGYSEPIIINTASAYGRYKRSLQSLHSLKTLFDHAIEIKAPQLDKKSTEIMQEALKESEDTPFFDMLDRFELTSISEAITSLTKENQSAKLYPTAEQLNRFLFEHEMLDDRERDRDFFVAMRGLSRLIESLEKDKIVRIERAVGKIIEFLKERKKRWQLRFEHIGFSDSALWQKIARQDPFNKNLQKINKLTQNEDLASQTQSLTILSSTVKDYQEFITQLEKLEDKRREEQEKEKQQGLADTQDTLRALQKEQGKVSEILDQAHLQKEKDLEEKWHVARMKQKTNSLETKKLVNKMQSFSPEASVRIEYAASAMEKTLSTGDERNFIEAESASDLAGRLLRQALKESESQPKNQKLRKRRRVAGDNYYGQSVFGGDIEIKSDYRVNHKYREDILDDVQDESYNKDEKVILDRYLKEIIR